MGAPSIKASGSIRFQFFTGRSRSEGVDIPAVSLWLSGHRRVFCYWWNDDPPPQPGGRSSSGPSGFNLWMARRMSASSCASTSASVNHRGPSCGPPRSRHSASHRSTSVLAFWSSCFVSLPGLGSILRTSRACWSFARNSCSSFLLTRRAAGLSLLARASSGVSARRRSRLTLFLLSFAARDALTFFSSRLLPFCSPSL